MVKSEHLADKTSVDIKVQHKPDIVKENQVEAVIRERES